MEAFVFRNKTEVDEEIEKILSRPLQKLTSLRNLPRR